MSNATLAHPIVTRVRQGVYRGAQGFYVTGSRVKTFTKTRSGAREIQATYRRADLTYDERFALVGGILKAGR